MITIEFTGNQGMIHLGWGKVENHKGLHFWYTPKGNPIIAVSICGFTTKHLFEAQTGKEEICSICHKDAPWKGTRNIGGI